MFAYFKKKKQPPAASAAAPTAPPAAAALPSSDTRLHIDSPVSPVSPLSSEDAAALRLPPVIRAGSTTDEAEAFFQQLATEVELPPPLPERTGGRATVISDDGLEIDHGTSTPTTPSSEAAATTAPGDKSRKTAKDYLQYWHYIPAVYITERVIEQVPSLRQKLVARSHSRSPSRDKKKADETAAVADHHADNKLHAPGDAATAPVDEKEAAKEKRDLNQILQNLNLSWVNNGIVTLSKDSHKLLEQFTQVLRDIINGVPTAYDDLENLLTNKQKQLDDLFDHLPPYLQTLIKSLPTKMYAYIAPQLAAAAAAAQAEGKGKSGKGAAGGKKSKRSYVPSLKSLLGEKGAVLAMLRSILGFLRMRFPMLLGIPEVLIGLAVFLLLFVFWYCHKRGREVRLEKTAGERDDGEVEVEEADDEQTDEQVRQAALEGLEEERQAEHEHEAKDKGKERVAA